MGGLSIIIGQLPYVNLELVLTRPANFFLKYA